LKAAEQSILFRHFHALAKDFDAYKTLIGIKQIVVCWWLQRFAGLLAHWEKYSTKSRRQKAEGRRQKAWAGGSGQKAMGAAQWARNI
jgi:hypothetical protein